MDAKVFGVFLGRIRRQKGLTQAELAKQLNVTDKAVSRWERGVGLPDINLLEPLADALGISLADLMHCRESQEDQQESATLEDFLSMLQRQKLAGWHSVRSAMFWLAVIFAICGVLLCRGTIMVQWRADNSGIVAFHEMQSIIIFPLLTIGEFFTLELWNIYEQVGLFPGWGQKSADTMRLFCLTHPLIHYIKIFLDYFFFITCGFILPAAELFLIVANLCI